MHTVNILLRNAASPLSLVYDSGAQARAVFDRLHKAIKDSSDLFVLKDDYELEALVKPSDISSVTFSDFAKDMDKNGDMALISAKAQLRAQSAARSDPGLSMLNTQGHGFPRQ